jgi:hypothetical protein
MQVPDSDKLTKPERIERFARACARGLNVDEAAAEAGYESGSDWPRKLAKRADFTARVAALSFKVASAGSDLEPVIAALLTGADRAMKQGSAGAFNAAARMLAEAGRLKLKLPKTARSDTLKQWARQFTPEVDRVAAAARTAD